MGLMQWLHTTTEPVNQDTDFDVEETATITTWRKQYDIQIFMEDLYFERGGHDTEFYGATLKLTSSDLDEFERVFDAKDWPNIQEARAAIARGETLYYDWSA